MESRGWPDFPTTPLQTHTQHSIASSLALKTKLALQTPDPHPLSRNTCHLPATPRATAPTWASQGPFSNKEEEDPVKRERKINRAPSLGQVGPGSKIPTMCLSIFSPGASVSL